MHGLKFLLLLPIFVNQLPEYILHQIREKIKRERLAHGKKGIQKKRWGRGWVPSGMTDIQEESYRLKQCDSRHKLGDCHPQMSNLWDFWIWGEPRPGFHLNLVCLDSMLMKFLRSPPLAPSLAEDFAPRKCCAFTCSCELEHDELRCKTTERHAPPTNLQTSNTTWRRQPCRMTWLWWLLVSQD